MKKLTLISVFLFFIAKGNAQPSSQSFTTSGTFTVPAGVTTITIEAIGAGGNGGFSGGGGGGGGGYAKGTYSVTPLSILTVTVGIAGSGATGGTSSVGSLITATGGENGTSGGAISGGTGGIGTGGNISNFTGGNGGEGTHTYFGGGGGGSAGANGNGNVGGNAIPWTGNCLTPGGYAGAGGGAPGGNGGKGSGFIDASCTMIDAAGNGQNYGGGGGGGNGIGSAIGNGAGGYVNISWCTPSTGTDIISTCSTITWIDGNTYTTSNNTATHVLTSVAGCDSIVTLNLTINKVSDVSTNLNGLMITAINTNASYRWLDCDNNYIVIIGENSQTFTATENGSYAVELTENGCTDTSACVLISTVGLIGNSNGNNNIVIYPNPTQGNLIVNLGNTYDKVNVIVRNVIGLEVLNETVNATNMFNIKLNEPAGIYTIEISETDNIKVRLKVIKQ